MSSVFRPRPVYINDSFLLPVGRYNGKPREKLSFIGLDEAGWTRCSAALTEWAQRFAAVNPMAHLVTEIPVDKNLAGIKSGRNYLHYDPLSYYDFCTMSNGAFRKLRRNG